MSDNLRLLYLRHGQTELNREQRMQGVVDEPLNEPGRDQIRRAAERLRREEIDVVYASDLPRAMETARIVCEPRGLAIRPEPRIREQDLGEWEGQPWLELSALYSEEDVRRFQSSFDFAPPGGESRRSVNERVIAFLEELPEKHAGKTVLAVSHGGPLLALMYHVLGLPDGTFNRFYGVNGGLTEFARDRIGWRLVTFNEMAYLAD